MGVVWERSVNVLFFFFSSRTQYLEEVEVQVCLICTIHNVLLHVPFPFCGYIILYMHFLPLTLSLSLSHFLLHVQYMYSDTSCKPQSVSIL